MDQQITKPAIRVYYPSFIARTQPGHKMSGRIAAFNEDTVTLETKDGGDIKYNRHDLERHFVRNSANFFQPVVGKSLSVEHEANGISVQLGKERVALHFSDGTRDGQGDLIFKPVSAGNRHFGEISSISNDIVIARRPGSSNVYYRLSELEKYVPPAHIAVYKKLTVQCFPNGDITAGVADGRRAGISQPGAQPVDLDAEVPPAQPTQNYEPVPLNPGYRQSGKIRISGDGLTVLQVAGPNKLAAYKLDDLLKVIEREELTEAATFGRSVDIRVDRHGSLSVKPQPRDQEREFAPSQTVTNSRD